MPQVSLPIFNRVLECFLVRLDHELEERVWRVKYTRTAAFVAFLIIHLDPCGVPDALADFASGLRGVHQMKQFR